MRKSFRKAGYKAIFKSNTNLKTLLTAKNKSKLPDFSHPGVYSVECNCGKHYVGETGRMIGTRINEHVQSIEKRKWDSLEISMHTESYERGYKLENIKVLKIEGSIFDRKVREALEIQ